MQESEEQPVGVPCVGGAGPGADQQFEEVFQRPQGGWRPLPEEAGEWPGDQQRYRVGVSEREAPEGGGKAAQFLPPVSGSGVDGEVRSRACPRRRIVRAWEPSVSTICRAAAVMRSVLMPGRLRSAGSAGMCMRALTCRPSGVGATSRFTM